MQHDGRVVELRYAHQDLGLELVDRVHPDVVEEGSKRPGAPSMQGYQNGGCTGRITETTWQPTRASG
jgi:hypothetical protein